MVFWLRSRQAIHARHSDELTGRLQQVDLTILIKLDDILSLLCGFTLGKYQGPHELRAAPQQSPAKTCGRIDQIPLPGNCTSSGLKPSESAPPCPGRLRRASAFRRNRSFGIVVPRLLHISLGHSDLYSPFWCFSSRQGWRSVYPAALRRISRAQYTEQKSSCLEGFGAIFAIAGHIY